MATCYDGGGESQRVCESACHPRWKWKVREGRKRTAVVATDRYNGEGVTGPCPTLNDKHPVAQHSRGEKIPHTQSVRPPRLPQASSDMLCPQPVGATLPARALGLSSLPGHRADVLGRQLGEECPACHRSPVCKPEVGQGVAGRPRGPGRQGSCCPAPRAVPTLSRCPGQLARPPPPARRRE